MAQPPKQQDRQAQSSKVQGNGNGKTTVLPCKRPTLIRLEVEGAATRSAGDHWEVAHDTKQVCVKAVTSPDDAGAWSQLIWNKSASSNRCWVSRSQPGKHRILANFPWEDAQFVDIEILDLTDITCPLPKKLGERRWKMYEANRQATLTATTVRDEKDVWSLLQWSGESAGAGPNQRQVNLATARDVVVKATLGKNDPKTLAADLRVCKWPQLEVQEIRFDSLPVVKDGADHIDEDFETRWVKGRGTQDPLWYVAGLTISLEVDFKVTTAPTEEENVPVRGEGNFGGAKLKWEGSVDVKPSSKIVTFQATANAALPDKVDCYDPASIEWSMVDSDQKTWKNIGKTEHLIYVTFRASKGGTAYWTLLDISCRAAKGKAAEADVWNKAFEPFTTHTGDGKGFKRKGDGVQLSYYKDGVDTEAGGGVYETRGILSRKDGTGRCGGWADFLMDMMSLQGIDNCQKLWFVRDDPNTPNMKHRFLVNNCSFTGPGSLSPPYPYKGNSECKKLSGAPGQGKTNPQFDFGDHVVVEYDGKIYDPSYGIGPITGKKAYEDKAIAGLGTMERPPAYHDFLDVDGTPQFFSAECSKGYVERTVGSGETLAAIAAATTTGVPAAAIFNDPLNAALKAKRGTPDKVAAGDVVYIPRSMAKVPMLRSKYL